MLTLWSLSSAALRKRRRFKKRISLVVAAPGRPPYPCDDLLTSRKEPDGRNCSEIFALCTLAFVSFRLGNILVALKPKPISATDYA